MLVEVPTIAGGGGGVNAWLSVSMLAKVLVHKVPCMVKIMLLRGSSSAKILKLALSAIYF